MGNDGVNYIDPYGLYSWREFYNDMVFYGMTVPSQVFRGAFWRDMGANAVAWGEGWVNAVEKLLQMPGEMYDLAKFLMSPEGRALVDRLIHDPCFRKMLAKRFGQQLMDFFARLSDPEELARMLGEGTFDVLFSALGGGLAKKLLQFVDEMGIMCKVAARLEMGADRLGLDLGDLTKSICFVAGTLVATADGGAAIESLHVGDRVLTTDAQAIHTSVDPESWRKITLEATRDGQRVEIETLRSPEWMAQNGCAEGKAIWLEITAIGLADWAQVKAVEPCPPIAEGTGRVVLTTIKQTATAVMDIRLSGQSEPLCPTPNHRLFSATRQDWVKARDLAVGEELETRTGKTRVEAISLTLGAVPVYNLEVEYEHCYFTGHEQVLSHNSCLSTDLTGQIHHGIPRRVHKALEQHPNLKGVYQARDSRFVTQAKDTASHRGYQKWHRDLDTEVSSWIKSNPNATSQQFENYLIQRYNQPDLLNRFPNGL